MACHGDTLLKCSICGGEATQFLQLEGNGKEWDIYKCSKCLVQFVYPIPSDKELRDLYQDYYDSDGLADLMNPNYGVLSFPRQWQIIRHLVKKKEGKILDVGCGGGHFLSRVSKDWQRYGVEISARARDIAAQKGISVLDSLEWIRYWKESFDVVVMFATIEHLPNPKQVVEQLARLLKVGGLLVVMTGDVSSLKARMQGNNWHLYTPPGHLYFFTAHSVDYLMESVGLKKIKHLYTDGGVTRIPFAPLNLALRAGLEVSFRIPMLNRLPIWDTYYGYYRKERSGNG